MDSNEDILIQTLVYSFQGRLVSWRLFLMLHEILLHLFFTF